MNDNPFCGPAMDPVDTRNRIRRMLGEHALSNGFEAQSAWHNGSAVLILIGSCPDPHRGSQAPCLILNKRSPGVRQPGDLCFPGGGISPRLDRLLAGLLRLPGSPLRLWPLWPRWHRIHRDRSGPLALALAIALREAWEEVRLNPFRSRFLGYLPLHHLVAFERSIHPLVAEIGPTAFKPNWEVERIVSIPLQQLLDQRHYARFRPMVTSADGAPPRPLHDGEFPCFVFQDEGGRELLWGATFRMVETFLRIAFGFRVPDMRHLPAVSSRLAPNYPLGNRVVSNPG